MGRGLLRLRVHGGESWSLTPIPSSQGRTCGLSLDWYCFYMLYLKMYIFKAVEAVKMLYSSKPLRF